MNRRLFGTLPSGETIDAWTLANSSGASVEILTLGGIIRRVHVPDRHGQGGNVVLGLETLEEYLVNRPYFGAIVGRIAGRVAGGRISCGGREHFLPQNEQGGNHLHGGFTGLHRRRWQATPPPSSPEGETLELYYVSPDGEEGYPGEVRLTVRYTFSERNELTLTTRAESDRETPVSLTNHTYFNLSATNDSRTNCLQIIADETVAVDERMILRGRRESVAGRACDLRAEPRRLQELLDALPTPHGDLYSLRTPDTAPPRKPVLVARVLEPGTGRQLQIRTDEACLQYYSGMSLDGRPHEPFSGFCLECQGYPNATTQPGFESILVSPGQPRIRTTCFAFSTL